jgi:hypothetical protein
LEGQPYVHLNWTHVATDDHQQLALEAARQSIVLLQNPSAVLPLKPGGKLLVAGPNSAATALMLGNYNGAAAPMQPLWTHIAATNGAQGLTANSSAVDDACKTDPGSVEGIPVVVAAVAAADAVILALGGDCHEGEGTDRDFLHLPGVQSQLFKAVLAATAGTKKKLVVVMINGGEPNGCVSRVHVYIRPAHTRC